MRKLLLTAGILALSASLTGAETGNAEGVVSVTAKIIKPLVIETSELNYGTVIQGEKGKWAGNPGTVKISGNAGEKIKIEIKNGKNGNYVKYTGPAMEVPVELKTGNGTAENEKMTAGITLFTPGEQGDSVTDGTYSLNIKTGEIVFAVNGPLNTSDNQKPGEYTGEVYIKAMYQ